MKYFYILQLLLSSSFVFAQAPDIVWEYKITAVSQGFKNLSGVKLIETNNNNGIIIAGNSNISVPWLAKFSTNGINEWNRGRPFNDTIPSLIMNVDQNAMILSENKDSYILNAFQKVNKPFVVTSKFVNLAIMKSDTTGTENLMSKDSIDILNNPSCISESYNAKNLLIACNSYKSNKLYTIINEVNRFGKILNSITLDTLFDNSKQLKALSINKLGNNQYVLVVGNTSLVSYDNAVYFTVFDSNLIKIKNLGYNLIGNKPNTSVIIKKVQISNNEIILFGNTIIDSIYFRPFIKIFNFNLQSIGEIGVNDDYKLESGFKIKDNIIFVGSTVKSGTAKKNYYMSIVNSNLTINKLYNWGDENDNVLLDVVANENEIYVTGSNGNDLYAAKIKQIANSIESNNTKYSISPNPANNYIKINGLNGDETFEIIDIKGLSIISLSAKANIDIENIPNGTYFLKINSKGYQEIRRFVVNH